VTSLELPIGALVRQSRPARLAQAQNGLLRGQGALRGVEPQVALQETGAEKPPASGKHLLADAGQMG